jgi:hypothetical protein
LINAVKEKYWDGARHWLDFGENDEKSINYFISGQSPCPAPFCTIAPLNSLTFKVIIACVIINLS